MKNYEVVAQISTTLRKPDTVSLGLFSAHQSLEQNKPQTLTVMTRAEMQLLSTGTNAMRVYKTWFNTFRRPVFYTWGKKHPA